MMEVPLEFQRVWARRDTYDEVIAIVKQHAGAYGSGVEYAYCMVHGQAPDDVHTGAQGAKTNTR